MFSGPIAERVKAKPIQGGISWDTCLKMVPKDGIPKLVQPAFVSANELRFESEEMYFLGWGCMLYS